MVEILRPARLAFAKAGIPWSEQYGDVYHSDEGGPGQARHVFLAGNRLPERWQGRDRFVILETGFGTGLNFLSTWKAWQDDALACHRLHYISLEKHPFTAHDLATLHQAWPEFAACSSQLRHAWPSLVPGFHRLEFEAGRLQLTLLFGEAAHVLAKLKATVDAYYLDGFAPTCNPDIWSNTLLTRLGQIAGRGATLATWSVSAAVRDGLKLAGFDSEKIVGFGRKREMLIGRMRLDRQLVSAPERKAIVVGAGIAGSTCCERLASRGWQITLIERRPQPAMEASGNLAGILMPLVSRDDNIASRLSRAAYLYALRAWWRSESRHAGARLAACGVMQFARQSNQETAMRQTAEALCFPREYLQFMSQTEAETHFGHPAPMAGWLFPQGGWANPPSLCQAALQLAGAHVDVRLGQAIKHIEHGCGLWRVLDESSQCLAEAPILILANGTTATQFQQASPLPIKPVRGQVSLLPEARLPRLTTVLCRDGYVAPAVDGLHAVGASYDFDADPAPRVECDLANLHRLSGLLPGFKTDPADIIVSSRVGFRPVTPDRLPIAGALPDWSGLPVDSARRLIDLPRQAGLYGLLGYASRGLVWANLMAEILVCQLESEPLPIEADLLDAVDPGRFALRRIRKGK